MTGFTAFMADGVKGAMEAEEAGAQLEAVLKSTDGAAGMTKNSLVGLADGMEKVTKFSSESVQAGESLLLTFTNIGSKVFPEATKTAADMAQAMGTDVSSQAISLGKALNDPIKGISALSRVGVTFTDQQKAQIKAMQESGDMAGAQTVILNELKKEFGGSAEAAGNTFAGKLERLKNAFGAVSESVVTGLMPYLQKFSDWAINNMPTIQQNVEGVLNKVGNAIQFIANNSNILVPILGGLATAFIAMKIIGVVNGLMAAYTAFTTTATGVQIGLNAAMLANPIGLIVVAIAALIAIGIALYMNWDKIKTAASKAFGKVQDIIGGAVEKIKGYFQKVIDFIKNNWQGILLFIVNPFAGAFKLAYDNCEGFRNKVNSIFNNLYEICIIEKKVFKVLKSYKYRWL
jgi:phage-related protein